MVDECRERVVPEGVNPGPDVGQAVWVDAIQPSRADRTHPDQARSMQHPQVLRDRRLADLTVKSGLVVYEGDAFEVVR